VYELICPSCGDRPDLDFLEVPLWLQWLRGPRTLEEGLAAYHKHIGIPWTDADRAGSSGPGQATAQAGLYWAKQGCRPPTAGPRGELDMDPGRQARRHLPGRLDVPWSPSDGLSYAH
jgi:hypothetical protein